MRTDRQFDAESPTIEVIAFRHGDEIGRELCDSPEAAARAVEEWCESPGVTCEVDDLSVHHRPEDILEPTPDDVEFGT